jgi:hypothetical protein
MAAAILHCRSLARSGYEREAIFLRPRPARGRTINRETDRSSVITLSGRQISQAAQRREHTHTLAKKGRENEFADAAHA